MLLLPIFAVSTKPSVDCPVVVTVSTVRGPLSPVLSLGTMSLGYSVIRSISRVSPRRFHAREANMCLESTSR